MSQKKKNTRRPARTPANFHPQFVWRQLKNGNLKITANNDARRLIKEWEQEGKLGDSLFFEILECLDDLELISADELGAMTDGWFLTDCKLYDDDGSDLEIGNLWRFRDYWFKSEAEELKLYGRIEFTLENPPDNHGNDAAPPQNPTPEDYERDTWIKDCLKARGYEYCTVPFCSTCYQAFNAAVTSGRTMFYMNPYDGA